MTREYYRRHSREFCALIGRPLDQLNDLVELWDSTFRVSYFEARQRVKDIAAAALLQVRDVAPVELAVFEADGESAVCFVDDDDWFAPDLGQHLSFGSKCEALIWSHVAVGSPTYPLQRFPSGASDLLCYTNNYAVSGSYASAHGVGDVAQHWIADRRLRELRHDTIPETLSVANKHPASVVFLERNLGSARDGHRLRRILAEFVNGTAAVDAEALRGIEWARPHIEATNDFFAHVLESAT